MQNKRIFVFLRKQNKRKGMKMTEQQRATIERYVDAIDAHGYAVVIDPIEGQEDLYIASLREALDKILGAAAFLSKQYGYRGLSKNMLAALATQMPSPVWGIEARP